MAKLYLVYDIVSKSTIGGIIRHELDAPAIRTFQDALSAKDSPFAEHPNDYELIEVGDMDNDGIITGGVRRVVVTGAAIVAANQPRLVKETANG